MESCPILTRPMIVSGDFFDVLDIADDKAGLFICDVMGHDVRAALVAATIRSLLTELRPVRPWASAVSAD
jgi:serine phosphatase RsbU (regulator of sigma subunit)